MSAAQDYYDQVLGMGHTPENALAHTRQHYPNFVPGTAEAVAAPVMTPVSQQAVPALQPVAQPVIAAAPAMTAPMAAVAPVEAPAAAHPGAYTPMAATPLPTDDTTPMMWAAVGCIVFALLLSMAAQFNHEWMVFEEENTLGLSAGLTTIRADCAEATPLNEITQANATDQCKAMAYVWFADDMEAASAENKSVDDLDIAFVSSHENYCNNTETLMVTYALILSFDTTPELDPLRYALGSSVRICANVGYRIGDQPNMEPPLDESKTGVVLWLGSIVALLGTGMLSTAAVGREMPSNIERHGMWVGFTAGAVIIGAVLVFGQDTSRFLFGTSMGMGAYMAVLAGVLGIVAGVLAYLDQK
jgi:hypothetical protein